jgi:hypothetical protein
VHFRYHSKVSKYRPKGNEPEILLENIDMAVEAVVKNESNSDFSVKALAFVLNILNVKAVFYCIKCAPCRFLLNTSGNKRTLYLHLSYKNQSFNVV